MNEGRRSTSPVRLIGADDDVIRVAECARSAIDADPQLARELLPGLASLWRARQAAVTPRTPIHVHHPPAADESRGSARAGVLWSVLLGAALVSMLAFAWVLAPPVRGFAFATGAAQSVLVVAGPVALLLLVIAVVTDIHASAAQVRQAVLWAGIVEAISTFVVVYRLIVGSSQGTALPPEQMVIWFAWCVLLLALLGVLIARWNRSARAAEESIGASWRGAPDQRSDSRRVIAVARELAKKTASVPAVTATWERSLAELPGVDDATISQARTLGPISWLVWTVYDGDLDVRTLRIG